ncbi:hypothetical protein NF700_12315 [Sphingomonadaceae bacterium OTU29MARTA1]|nr:hypothetical protein NF700_12315 [Sphingomonadaceae bacterium OTU29MARTA1]
MSSPPKKPMIRKSAPAAPATIRAKKPGGGTAAGGGINFQAAVTATAGAHMLRGSAIGWLPVSDVPVAVWAESEGAGDDVRLELATGQNAEVQAKKGLNRGKALWTSLEAMVVAVRDGRLDYGVLAVAPDSSGTVREDLAKDLQRLAQGRSDHLTDIGKELHRRLKAIGGDWAAACRCMTVRVVHALEADGADIRAAKEVLRSVCADDGDADAAWNALYQDAVLRIEHRGRWTVPHLLEVLGRAGIAIRDAQFPASVSKKLADWVASTNRGFTLPTIRRPLPLDALLEMRTLGTTIDQPQAEDAATALARYHGASGSLDRDAAIFGAEWTGRFRRQAVVVAGPGLGKSTLMTLLAARYAAEGLPVLTVKLKPVAAAMTGGTGFDQALRQQALAGSGMTPEQFDRAALTDLVVLADGLDDCGTAHDAVARALGAFALGHRAARVIVTTRPIGYTTSALAEWQHYRLLAPDKDHGAVNLGKLLAAAQGESADADKAFRRARRELARSQAAETISTSPLLLGMAAAVIHARGELPDTRPRLYAELVGLFEASGGSMTPRPVAGAIATRVLDCLGWLLMQDPLVSVERLVERLGALLGPALGRTPLAAVEIVEPTLGYWEQLGIIERLHHGGVAYWTFVHKSFTEFTAARHLMAMADAERAHELDRLVDDSDWHEVVGFAGGLGLSDEIARLFVDRRAAGHAGQMERALALAADRDAAVSDEQIRRLAELAFAMIEEKVPDRIDIGEALANLAEARPAILAPTASARRDHAQPAVQLVAWACLAAAGPNEQDAAEMAARLDALLPTISWSVRTSLLGGLQLGGRKDRDLIERIALAALDAQPAANLKSFVETQLVHQALGSWGFRSRVEALLRVRGGGEPVKLPWERSTSKSIFDLMKPDDAWRNASKKALRVLAEGAITAGGEPADAGIPPRLPQFGALYALSNFGEVPAYDIYKWDRPFDPVALRTIVQAAAHASAIDPQALGAEAAAVIRRIETDDRIETFGFDLPAVDIPDPDWAKAATLVPDRAMLVAAMNHGSEWLAYLAGNILAAARASPAQSRALLDGNGSSLWAATAVVRGQQPVDVANAIILDRLSGPLPSGAEHLFRGLQAGGVDQSPAVDAAIRAGLASSHDRVAEAAANLAEALAQRGQPIASAVLLEGYDRWTGLETGTRDGVIPPSPRATLLNLLIANDALGEDRLWAALSDTRSDVSSVASEHVIAAVATSSSLRHAISAAIRTRALPPRIVASVLESEPPFSSEHVGIFETLLGDADAKWRRAGLEVLRTAYLSNERILKHVAVLSRDDNEEIRNIIEKKNL